MMNNTVKKKKKKYISQSISNRHIELVRVKIHLYCWNLADALLCAQDAQNAGFILSYRYIDDTLDIYKYNILFFMFVILLCNKPITTIKLTMFHA